MRRQITIAGALSVFLFFIERVNACSTCLCGDPTITTMGTEKPYAGRLRLNVSYLDRSEIVGEPDTSEHRIDESRFIYSASYAPSADWIISASLPVVEKRVRRFDLSEEHSRGLGDADIAARWYLKKDRHNLWGLQFGLRIPTSSEQSNGGQPIDIDALPGAGATIPSLGLWYGWFGSPIFLYFSSTFQHGVDGGYQGYQPGDALLFTAHAQYALVYKFALSLSLDSRWKEKDQFYSLSNEDSGGLLMMVSPGLNWTPISDVVLNLAYQIPTIDKLNGRQKEKPNLYLGVTYDF